MFSSLNFPHVAVASFVWHCDPLSSSQLGSDSVASKFSNRILGGGASRGWWLRFLLVVKGQRFSSYDWSFVWAVVCVALWRPKTLFGHVYRAYQHRGAVVVTWRRFSFYIRDFASQGSFSFSFTGGLVWRRMGSRLCSDFLAFIVAVREVVAVRGDGAWISRLSRHNILSIFFFTKSI